MSDRYRGSYVGKTRDNPRRNDRYENPERYNEYAYPQNDRNQLYRDERRSPRRREYEKPMYDRNPEPPRRNYEEYRDIPRHEPRMDQNYQRDRYPPKYNDSRRLEPINTRDSYNKDVIKESIFLSNLPRDITINELANLFGSIGVIQTDKRSGLLKIKLFYNNDGSSKGEASIYYEDPMAAEAAIKWFNQTEIRGQKIGVEIAVRSYSNKFIEAEKEARRALPERDYEPRDIERDRFDGNRRERDSGRGRGRGRGGFGGREKERDFNRDEKKSFIQPGDWMCLNCKNNNFAWRDSCNRCQTPKAGGDSDRNHPGSSNYGSQRHRSPPTQPRGSDPYREYQRNYPYNT